MAISQAAYKALNQKSKGDAFKIITENGKEIFSIYGLKTYNSAYKCVMDLNRDLKDGAKFSFTKLSIIHIKTGVVRCQFELRNNKFEYVFNL
jgi:hypothetical protein